jgi:hypothetical protein
VKSKERSKENPVQNWDVANVADGVMELVETVMTKNHHVIRNHYTTKKKEKNIMAEIRHF